MKKSGLITVLPLYIWTVLMVAFPMGYVLALSFMTPNGTYGVNWVFSTDAYKALFGAVNLRVMGKSFAIGGWTTLITLLLGYPFACAMARQPRRRRSLLMLLVIVPFWTSALLRIYGWMIVLKSNGLLNAALRALGVTASPIKFLYNDGATLFGMAYSFLPFMILPIYTSVEKLDASFREAARDLGANGALAFMTVTLPLTMPGVIAGCVLVFVPSVGMFFISDLMGGGTEMLLGNLISHYLHAGKNWPLGAALSMVMVVLTFLTMGVYRRVSDGGELGVF